MNYLQIVCSAIYVAQEQARVLRPKEMMEYDLRVVSARANGIHTNFDNILGNYIVGICSIPHYPCENKKKDYYEEKV